MKFNFTHIVVVRAILFVLILLYSLVVFGSRENNSKSVLNPENNSIHQGKKFTAKSAVNQSGNIFVIIKRDK